MKTAAKFLLAAALIGLLAVPLVASDRERNTDRQKRDKIREKMQFLRNWKMMEYLDLDEAQATKLFKALKTYDERSQALLEEGVQLVKQLKDTLAKENKNDKEIQTLLDKLRANMESQHEVKQQRLDAVKGILTVEKQAKYVLFELNFKKEMTRLAGRALARNPRSPLRQVPPGGDLPEPPMEDMPEPEE